jgi:hypothetical protein
MGERLEAGVCVPQRDFTRAECDKRFLVNCRYHNYAPPVECGNAWEIGSLQMKKKVTTFALFASIAPGANCSCRSLAVSPWL